MYRGIHCIKKISIDGGYLGFLTDIENINLAMIIRM